MEYRNRRLAGIFLFLLLLLCAYTALAQETAPLTFGVLADVQYADKANSGARHYRDSLHKLDDCITDFNQQSLEFVIELGDLIDSGTKNLPQVLSIFHHLTVPQYCVLGNHDTALGRAVLLPALGLKTPYYSFHKHGWRFIVLDTEDVSPEGGWPKESVQAKQGEKWLAKLKREGRPYAEPWNGGIGKQQLKWLMQQLKEATVQHERVIVCGHIPLLAEASEEWALLYNHEEVRTLLESYPCVAAYICGHAHGGGYALHHGIHHITLPGMVESSPTAYAIITLTPEQIEINGFGSVPDRVLTLLE